MKTRLVSANWFLFILIAFKVNLSFSSENSGLTVQEMMEDGRGVGEPPPRPPQGQ